MNHKQKESRERREGGGEEGDGEETGEHFAEPTMANFMQTKTEGDSSRRSSSSLTGGHERERASEGHCLEFDISKRDRMRQQR